MPKLTLDLRHLIKQCPDCQRRFSQVAVFCPFDGAHLAEAAAPDDKLDPLIGQTIDGRYVIESVVGEGGMGTVYRARHATLKRALAVKVLRTELAQEAELAARFLQEAQATAAIKHPNIVSISDFGRLGDGRPYFVMELLVGQTLAAVIRRGKLKPKLAADVGMALARGLAAAHAAGVIHRDLKPENVFLLDESAKELRVVDFGAALIMGASRLTKAGVVFGTPYYMSPEQAAGKPVDHRVDVYSLGVILYEMLTGHVPFEGDTYMGVLTQHMFVAPRPPSEAVPELHGHLGALEAVVLRALEKEPSARFSSMAELEAAMGDALESGPQSMRASRPHPPPQVSSEGSELPSLQEMRERLSGTHIPPRRSMAAVVVVMVVMTLAVVTGAVALLRSNHAQSAPTTSATSGAPPVASSVEAPVAVARSAAPPEVVSVAPVPTRTTTTAVKPPRPKPTGIPTVSTLPPDPFQ